jgi:hypothetical protein
MKELNDFLLNLFTSDKPNPVIAFPNLKNGVVYASDGRYVLIAVPETELSLKYNTNDKFPKAEELLDNFEKRSLTGINVRVSDLAKELVKARIHVDTDYIKCEECNGSGEVTWEYMTKERDRHEMTNDCPACEGKGEKKSPFARVQLQMIEDEGTGKLNGISIGELYFHPFQLYRLFMVALIKGYESIEIFFDKEKSFATITYFGNIKVLVMTMLNPK